MEPILKSEGKALRKAGCPSAKQKDKQKRKDFRPACVVARTKRGYWITDC